MAHLINKTRRPKFEVHLRVYDLNNVPLVQGVSFIKWHLPHSIHSEHRGRTLRCPIANHRVEYNYSRIIPVRIGIDKNNKLSECPIEFEILQEFNPSHVHGVGRDEKVTLGRVTLNLSEYVDESEVVMRETGFQPKTPITSSNSAANGVTAATAMATAMRAHGHARKKSSLSIHAPITPELGPSLHPSNTSPTSSKANANEEKARSINEPAAPAEPTPHQYVEDGVVRRYLMQESKINSTLKIGVLMVQVEGERNFAAPPLKTAAVFGGIPGVVGEANTRDRSLPAGVDFEFGPHHNLGLLDDVGPDGDFGLNGAGAAAAKARDTCEVQDMYRRALAASWACRPGELLVDECIDDIFSGGDGFGARNGGAGDSGSGGDAPVPGDATPRAHHQNSQHQHQHQHQKQHQYQHQHQQPKQHHHRKHPSSRPGFRLGIRREDSGSTSGGGDDEILRPSDRQGRGLGRGLGLGRVLGLGHRRHHYARQGSSESGVTLSARQDGDDRAGAAGGHQQPAPPLLHLSPPHSPPDPGLRRSGHQSQGSKESVQPPDTAGLLIRSDSLSSLSATIESEKVRSGFKSAKLVNEFDVRDDLVAWKLPGTVS